MFRKKPFNPQSGNPTLRRPLLDPIEYECAGVYDSIEFNKVNAKLESPVLFIGLGVSGLKVLQTLKEYLSNVYLGHLAEDFFFLCIGTNESIRPSGCLTAQEVVNLGVENSRDAAQKSLQDYLLNNQNSPVKNMVTRVLQSTNTNPPRKVDFVFINSLVEPESAISIPLCHWIRSIFQGKIHQVVDFPSLISLSNEDETTLGSDSVFLALRELYRFSSDSRQRLDIGIAGVSNLAQNFLFSKIILTDTKDEHVLVDSILNFLSLKQTTFELGRKDLVIYTDAISTARVNLPIMQIRKVISDHYKGSLFKGGSISFSQESIRSEVVDFLYKPLWNHDNFPFSIIGDSNNNQLRDIYYDLPSANAVEGFRWALIYYLNEKVFPIQDFGFEILRWQQDFLRELKRIIHVAATSLTFVTERHHGFASIHELHGMLPQMEQVIVDLESQVATWVAKSQAIISQSRTDIQSESDPNHVIGRSDPKTYQNDAAVLFPIDSLEKRSKWIWKKDDHNNYVLEWLFAPLEYSGPIRTVKSVSSDSIGENLELVDQSVAQIANRYIDSLDIFSEIEKNRKTGLALNMVPLNPALETKIPGRTAETAQMALAGDLDKLKKFSVSNQVENINCVDYFYKDQFSLSFIRIDQKVSLADTVNGAMLSRFVKVNPNSIVFDEEKNALDLEKELVLRKGDFFSPVFVGLMKNLSAFKTVMTGVYWGVFQPTPGLDKHTYCLKLGDGPKSVVQVSFGDVAPGSLKEILYYSLVYIPAESLDVRQLFYKSNFNNTLSMIEAECQRIKKSPTLRNTQREMIKSMFVQWEKSDDAFYRDLAKYLQSGKY